MMTIEQVIERTAGVFPAEIAGRCRMLTANELINRVGLDALVEEAGTYDRQEVDCVLLEPLPGEETWIVVIVALLPNFPGVQFLAYDCANEAAGSALLSFLQESMLASGLFYKDPNGD